MTRRIRQQVVPHAPTRTKKYGWARQMRKNPTPAEDFLWQHIRCRQLDGLRFRRQKLLFGWIADFYCATPPTVIEVDGSSHDRKKHSDKVRDNYMNQHGITVHRFTNEQVLNSIERVLDEIKWVAKERGWVNRVRQT